MKRYDYAQLKATKTDEGYLVDSPVITRSGIFLYQNEDGSIRKEYRPPEQVFNNDSLKSLLGKPITVDHPKVMVDQTNIADYTVGTVLSEGRADEDGVHLRADIIIHQPERCGNRRELSLGYDLDLIETPGEINGERYDAIQTNIRYNHLSVVRRARAGQQARLNLDNDEIIEIETGDSKMPKLRTDSGIEYEVPAEVIVYHDKLKNEAAVTKQALDSANSDKSKIEAERDALKSEVATIPEKIEKARKDALEQASQRLDLEATAKSFNVDCSGKSDIEIKKAVVNAVTKGVNFDGKDDAYINARFDIAVESRADSKMAEQRKQANNFDSANKEVRSDSKSAYEKHMDSLANAKRKTEGA
jgi:hypothetical protein